MTHTPTPWKVDIYKSVVDSNGKSIAANGFSMIMSYGDDQKQAQSNAVHIVKCVNAHDGLLEALQFIRDCSMTNPNDFRQVAQRALNKAGL